MNWGGREGELLFCRCRGHNLGLCCCSHREVTSCRWRGLGAYLWGLRPQLHGDVLGVAIGGVTFVLAPLAGGIGALIVSAEVLVDLNFCLNLFDA